MFHTCALAHILIFLSLVDVTYAGELEHAFAGWSVPDRKENCVASFEEVVITEPGCRNKTVRIGRCRGSCTSTFIPGHDGVLTCSNCAPNVISVRKETLECDWGTMDKEIRSFSECACQKFRCIAPAVTTDRPKVLRPCRQICRKCRKTREQFYKLRRKLDNNTRLRKTCKTKVCLSKILPHKSLKTKKRRKKLLMKKICKKCTQCKKDKKKKSSTSG